MKLRNSLMGLISRESWRVFIFGVISIAAFYLFSLLFASLTHNGIGFIEAWNRWDAPHYLSIAQSGYQNIGDEANFIVFYPLFPFLTYLVSIIFRNIFASSLIVSNFFYLLSIVYFYKLIKLDYDNETAWRAVVLLSIFPTAYFFHAPYTESLFLFMSVMSVYLGRKNNWLGASIFAILACLTRVTGVILPIILLIEFFKQKEKSKNYFKLFYFALIAIGPLIYLFINYRLFGDPLYFMAVQKLHWTHYSFGSPIINLIDTFKSRAWVSQADQFALVTMQLVFTLLSFVLSVIAFFKTRLSYALYAILSIALMTAPSFWMSNPRYVLVIFPIFIVLGILSKNRFVYYTLIAASLAMSYILFSIYLSGPFAF